jgi:hypothetical protein
MLRLAKWGPGFFYQPGTLSLSGYIRQPATVRLSRYCYGAEAMCVRQLPTSTRQILLAIAATSSLTSFIGIDASLFAPTDKIGVNEDYSPGPLHRNFRFRWHLSQWCNSIIRIISGIGIPRSQRRMGMVCSFRVGC